mgnify:CR=1 FL=1
MALKLLFSLILAAAAAPASAALSKTAEARLDEGLRQLYNLDYDRSRETFRKLIEAEPESPFGYLFEAGAIWWQSSLEYGLFTDTPTLQGLFEADIESAIDKAELLMKSKSLADRADGNFAGGMALGTRGQWSMLRGRWLQAYFDGKKAIKLLNKCVKIDPDYHDAYLGLGVFDYQVARFGGLLKFSAVIGLRGDEKRGLARMHQAMEKGRHASRQSAQFLSYIYLIDKKDYAKSLEVIQRLRKDIPDSAYYQLLEVIARHLNGDAAGSIGEARSLFEREQASPLVFKRKLLSLLCGLPADKCFDKSMVGPARAWLDLAVEPGNGNPPPGVWHTFTHFLRGQASDLLGKREDAAKDYQAALAGPDYAEIHFRAKECQKKACKGDAAIQYFRSLSRGDPWPPPAKRRPPAP